MQCMEDLGQSMTELAIDTPGRAMIDVSRGIQDWLAEAGVESGLLTIFIRHTSASLTIQENADPDVQADLLDSLDEFAPASAHYRHNSEGPDDMPAHIKSMLTSTSLSIPVMGGRLALGTWQGIYVVEHRARPHRRNIALHYSGTFQE